MAKVDDEFSLGVYLMYTEGDEQMTVKIRKVGNSNTLTVPNTIQPQATEYDVYQGRDGVIVFVPKHQNPFRDEEYINTHDLTQTEEIGGTLIGREIPED
ncbi:hypothetical protein FC91_GL002601 [Schleiferilactobacillus harbinensis DSM 16991]|uniref:AbrB family transcriptional regulator n=1 Tax=Schleiferilactobacillus harbinensis DSM 16991 TaxID=1122147 RepID=A0A0R1XBQ5_9LACO|nr:hypothetical protein FC91_GL002601 [Schleiferilactobacillus harbinensis DSM 16991]